MQEREDRRNQADRLIGYALEDVQELFVDQHGAPHALIDGEPVPLTSRCYSWLRRLMWEEEGRSVSGEYLKMAAGTLSAHSEFSGESRELYTRAAWHEDVLYYELRPGKVVRIGPGGWAFEATSNATRKPADRVENGNSGKSGNRYGDFSEEPSTPEQEERIRRLVKEGMSETWARRTVLADSHPLGCGCEVCL